MIYIFIYTVISFIFFSSFKEGRLTSSNSKQLAFFLFILALIVGLGDMLGGYDRYGYCDLFDHTADYVLADLDPFAKDSAIMGYSNEMSYVIINVLISHITANRYIFILILTFLIYFMLYLSLKEYLVNYPFGLLIFTALFFFFTFTYLRQVCATCFAWYAFRYVIKRRVVPFLICWFIAYQFHNSAIIFLPMYFIPVKKFSKKAIIIAMLLLFLIGAPGVSATLYSLYGETTGFMERTEQYERFGHSFRFDYVLEAVFFLYVIFKRYDKISENKVNIVFLNACLAFCAILLFFLTNSSAGRQAWYYMIGIIYMIPYLATVEKKPLNFIGGMYVLITVLFLRIVIMWGDLINPYKSFLTEGHRPNDVIYDEYEYDSNYDKNKFYRSIFYLK